jgi:hypothetical protein
MMEMACTCHTGGSFDVHELRDRASFTDGTDRTPGRANLAAESYGRAESPQTRCSAGRHGTPRHDRCGLSVKLSMNSAGVLPGKRLKRNYAAPMLGCSSLRQWR